MAKGVPIRPVHQRRRCLDLHDRAKFAHRCIRKARSSVSLEQAEYLAWEDDAISPDALVQSRQDSARVQRALSTLSYEQVRAIKQAYYEEKSHGEIAAEADIPLGTVKSRLRLAIQRLRTVLDNDT